MQERRNSSALAMELRLSCINPSIHMYLGHRSLFISLLTCRSKSLGGVVGCVLIPLWRLLDAYMWAIETVPAWLALHPLWNGLHVISDFIGGILGTQRRIQGILEGNYNRQNNVGNWAFLFYTIGHVPQWCFPSTDASHTVAMISYELHGISNHQQLNCLFNSLFRLTTKKISKGYQQDKLTLPWSPAHQCELTHCGLVTPHGDIDLGQHCCLTAPSHYLNPCWLVISKVQWESPEGNFTRNISVNNH